MCVCVCEHARPFLSLLGLFYFLVAGAAVRSLPAPCVCIRGLQPFPVRREEETIGNRMSIPGRRGQRGLGEVKGGVDDPGNRVEDHGYRDAPYQDLFSLLRVDSDVFF